jgi:hypothetical protein
MGKRLSSKEIHELREMLRITGTKASRFSETVSLSDVVSYMVDHIIDNEITKPPHIACFTVYQVLRGGFHWKQAEYLTRCGLLEHAGIAQPPNWYLSEQGKKFGYIMDWPPVAIRNVVTGSMRKNFINPILDGNIEVPYIIGWCRGYISEDNGKAQYMPEYGKFISSYFIMQKNESLFPNIQKHILQQPWWFRKQWKMMLDKIPDVIYGMKKLADTVHTRATALSRMWEIDEKENRSLLEDHLNPQIPEEMIDWRDKEED